VALLSGITFEDMFAGVTTLPLGWFVERVVFLANISSTN
jgi:hypothetical protein